MRLPRDVQIVMGMFAGVVLVGVIGYVILGWSLLDAMYMVTITLTTVGYREVHPVSPAGKVFTICLIVGGVGTVGYALRLVGQSLAEGRMQRIFGRMRVERQIEVLKDHYIVCGFGHIGRVICQELCRESLPFVVVDKDPVAVEECKQQEFLSLQGDATDDQVLKRVGVERAKALVAVLHTGADNLYVSLTARHLNPGLYIVAKAEDEAEERKLLIAGVSKVVSPYHIGGMQMARALTRPTVLDFIELVALKQSVELLLEELTVPADSAVIGSTIRDLDIRNRFGVIVVAVKRASGDMVFDSAVDLKIDPGDVLVALGEPENLRAFSERLGGSGDREDLAASAG